MRVNEEQIDNERIIVILNGRACRGVLEADSDEGWVRVIDPLGVPQLRPEYIKKDTAKAIAEVEGAATAGTAEGEQTEVEYSGWEEIPSKRLYGKVEFRKLG